MLPVDAQRLPKRQVEVLRLAAVDQWIQQGVGKEQHICDAVHVVLDCDVIRQKGIHARWQVQSIIRQENNAHHLSHLKNTLHINLQFYFLFTKIIKRLSTDICYYGTNNIFLEKNERLFY